LLNDTPIFVIMALDTAEFFTVSDMDQDAFFSAARAASVNWGFTPLADIAKTSHCVVFLL